MTLAPKKIEARSAALLGDFSEVVSKLALLTNAGMILREAWELTANAGEGIFYEEMQTAVAEWSIRDGSNTKIWNPLYDAGDKKVFSNSDSGDTKR